MSKISVAFICTHNSCRSQIAEALGKTLAGDTFESYSSIKDQINPDAVRLMKQHYGIDMLASGQKPKKITDLPNIDYRCRGVRCPFLPAKKRVDWGLEDPTGQNDEIFMRVITKIETKILALKEELLEE